MSVKYERMSQHFLLAKMFLKLPVAELFEGKWRHLAAEAEQRRGGEKAFKTQGRAQ